MSKRACFTCGKVKTLKQFQPNKRKYQIAKYMNVSINCTQCIIENTIKNMSCVRFNFDTNKFDTFTFQNVDQIYEFYNVKRPKYKFKKNLPMWMNAQKLCEVYMLSDEIYEHIRKIGSESYIKGSNDNHKIMMQNENP